MRFNYALTLASRCLHLSVTHTCRSACWFMLISLESFPSCSMISGLSLSLSYLFPFLCWKTRIEEARGVLSFSIYGFKLLKDIDSS